MSLSTAATATQEEDSGDDWSDAKVSESENESDDSEGDDESDGEGDIPLGAGQPDASLASEDESASEGGTNSEEEDEFADIWGLPPREPATKKVKTAAAAAPAAAASSSLSAAAAAAMPAAAASASDKGYASGPGSAFHKWLTGGASEEDLFKDLTDTSDEEGMSILVCSGCKAAICVCPPVCKVCDRTRGRHTTICPEFK